ncbi:MAG: CcdB family protein [Epsilonproteobacteria bacterium]|nr:CcdB family protein [Campylobacterota bacterium]
MAQFDVYHNTNPISSELFPYLLDVQNDLLSTLRTRVVVPLGVNMTPIRHLNPTFSIENQTVIMSTADMAGVDISLCSDLVTNLSDSRNEIIDALDFLVSGF